MMSAGVRQLREEASELLRRAQQGETIEITDRGRPVALLMPLPDDGPLHRLRVSGQVDESDGDLGELPAPLVLPSDIELPTAVLARLRRSEH